MRREPRPVYGPITFADALTFALRFHDEAALAVLLACQPSKEETNG